MKWPLTELLNLANLANNLYDITIIRIMIRGRKHEHKFPASNPNDVAI